MIITRDVVVVDEGHPAKFLEKQELVEFTELFTWIETTGDGLQAGSPPEFFPNSSILMIPTTKRLMTTKES